LTFKSIDDILMGLEGTALRRFLPEMDPDESDIREIFMPPALYEWLYQRDRKKTLNFKANVRGFLKRFVIGDEVDNQDYMKSWKDDVFELRVQIQPRRERIRIFGAFVRPDTLILIHQKPRSDFGGKNDPKWDQALDRVTEAFARLFANHPKLRAHPFSNCLTSNFIDVRDKAA
jgi:hypothetical protein